MLYSINTATEADRADLAAVKKRVLADHRCIAAEFFGAIREGRTLAAEWIAEEYNNTINWTTPVAKYSNEKMGTLEVALRARQINPFRMLLLHRADKNARTFAGVSNERLIHLAVAMMAKEFVAELAFAGADVASKGRCEHNDRGRLTDTFNYIDMGYYSPAEQARTLAEHDPKNKDAYLEIADIIDQAIAEGGKSVRKLSPKVGLIQSR